LPTINVPGIGEVFADGFAEEQTMNRILAVLQSSDNANSPEALQRLSAATNTSSNSIFNFGKRTQKAGTETQEGGAKVAQGFKAAAGASTAFSRFINQSSTRIVQGFSNLEKSPFALSQSLTKMVTSIEGLGGSIVGSILGGFAGAKIEEAITGEMGMLGATIGAVVGAASPQILSAIAGFLFEKLNSTSQAFMGVQRAGGIFGGSLINFRDNAHTAGLTMSEFTNIISKNGEAMASFGGQTNRGAREFSRANQRLIQLEGRSLLPLGVSFEDMGMATVDLMQKFANAGIPIEQIGIGTREFAKETANQIRQQKMMAAIMGRSIENQKEAERQQRRDVQVQAAIRNLGPKQQAEIERLITSFPKMRDVILDTVTFGDITSKGAAMMASAMPNMTDAFVQGTRDIKSGTAGAFEGLSTLAKNSDVIQGELDNNATIIAQLGRFTNNELVKTMEDSFLDFRRLAVGAMNKTGRDISTDMAQVGSESNTATNALIALQVENRKLAMNLSTLTTEFLKNTAGLVQFLGSATSYLNEGIAGLKSMAGITPSTQVGGFNTEVFGNITNQLNNLQNNATNNIPDPTGNGGGTASTQTPTPSKTVTINAPTMERQIAELTKIMRGTNSKVDQLTTNLT